MDRFLSIVTGLFERLGIGEVNADDAGIFSLYVDGDLPVFLRPGNDGAELVLHAGIGAVPDQRAGDLTLSLLQGTTVEMERSGFAFGMVPGYDQVILIGRCPVEGLTDEAAFALLERFVDAASGWRKIFDSLVARAEDEDDDAADGEIEAQGSTSGRRPPFEDFA